MEGTSDILQQSLSTAKGATVSSLTAEQTETSGNLTTKVKEVSVSHTEQVSGDTTISATMSPKTSSAATESLAASPSLSNPIQHHPASPKTSSADSQSAPKSPQTPTRALPSQQPSSAATESQAATTVSQSALPSLSNPTDQQHPPSGTSLQPSSGAATVPQSASPSDSQSLTTSSQQASPSDSQSLTTSSQQASRSPSQQRQIGTQHEPLQQQLTRSLLPRPDQPRRTRSATSLPNFAQSPRFLPNLAQSPPSRDKVEMEKWRRFVKRCHEVIAILTGFATVFSPLNFVIGTLRKNGGDPLVHPAAIVELIVRSVLQDYKVHIVYPFMGLGIAYGILYVASAATLPMRWVLIADILSIGVGFGATFLLTYHIWKPLTIFGGSFCGIAIIVLVWMQFPRERVRRDIARP